MKISMKFVSFVGALALGSAVYAFQAQQMPAAPDSHKATTSIVTDDKSGDAISLTYRTVKFSQKQVDAMKEDQAARDMWAKMMPGKLQAELTLPADVVYTTTKEHTLPKGKYGISFVMNPDASWTMRLMSGDKQAGKVNLKTVDSAVEFDHLTFNLMSAGEHDYKLAIGYGKMGSVIPFSIKAASAQ